MSYISVILTGTTVMVLMTENVTFTQSNHLWNHIPLYWWETNVYQQEEQLLDITVQPPSTFPLPAGHGIIHHFLQLVTALHPHQWQQSQIWNVRLSLLLLPRLLPWSLSAEVVRARGWTARITLLTSAETEGGGNSWPERRTQGD